jgi:queuine tRNA-ribosyltransferase/7-cyano-7-deazaguanine tRNA-ribosyltransferase
MSSPKKIFEILSQDGHARLGRLTTPHGVIETPSYVVVGTDGHVRCLEPDDLKISGIQIIISNTFHLWQTLGDDGLTDFPGLHDFMEWTGPIMTDSGGFQVFSLGSAREHGTGKIKNSEEKNFREENLVRVTNSGVYFKNKEGEEVYLDAELSMRIQDQLGADIIFAFDEPSSPHHDYAYTKIAMERTHAWAERSLEAKISKQLLYGIVQGGIFEDLRKESAQYINSLPFDGFGIGGAFSDSFGSKHSDTLRELDWVLPFLNPEKPRHLLGIGRIEDVFDAVERGVDTMDCVIPTREARHGSIWTKGGRFDVKRGANAVDDSPLVAGCECFSCDESGITKAKLYELFKAKSPEAPRYATIHNVYFFNDLMAQIRSAIKESRFGEFKKWFLS